MLRGASGNTVQLAVWARRDGVGVTPLGWVGPMDRSRRIDWPHTSYHVLSRGNERPLREVLTYLVWRQGSYGLAEIGRNFGVGYSRISHSRKRGKVEDRPTW